VVGIVSPSWPGAALFPHRLERGVTELERLGFRVRLGRHALGQRGFVSATGEERASDLHELFRDPEVRAVIAAIGGDHSAHLLPHLDFDLLAQHPTVLMGYSDVTVLNVALWRTTGLVTCNGPALLTDFAENPHTFPYTEQSFLRTLCRAEPVGRVEPADSWTEEFLDWHTRKDLERPRRRNPSPGWTWLKPGRAEGVLVGGCLESLQHLRGTRYWPDFEEAIFFWETSEEKPPPERVDGILMDYENMGILDRLRGMLVARPMGYSDADKVALRRVVLERTCAFAFPVVTDMDFGHTEPRFVLPLGCRARIDTDARSFEILEAAVA
jgi:muramoyltetrapeptide carboxypeptidase